MFIPGVETNRPRGRDFNHAKPIDYAVGLTPCEPADVFSEGEVFDPLAPPQLYDEKGLPLCCINIMNVTGGVLWGGSAALDFVPSPPPDCEDAVVLALGVWYQWQQPPGPSGWVQWPVIAGHTYRCRYTDDGPINFTFTCLAFNGPDPCPGTLFGSGNHLSPMDVNRTPASGDTVISYRMDNPSAFPVMKHFRVDDIT